jgi:hypothetical protein
MTNDLALPDGITRAELDAPGDIRRVSGLLPIVVLAIILGLALCGLFGGGKATRRIVRTEAATLAVTTPSVMRNGIYFETRIAVTARRDIGQLVLAVPESLWRDETISAQVPQASDETFEDGEFRFSYGKLKAGETFNVKIDGQVNPPLVAGNSGSIRALDGKAELAVMPLSIKVLP